MLILQYRASRDGSATVECSASRDGSAPVAPAAMAERRCSDVTDSLTDRWSLMVACWLALVLALAPTAGVCFVTGPPALQRQWGRGG